MVSCGALLAGCGADPRAENQEIISNLIEAGFPSGDIQLIDDAVYLGGDGRVSLEASQEMLQRGDSGKEHYRSANLVDTNLVKRICINPTSTLNSYARLS